MSTYYVTEGNQTRKIHVYRSPSLYARFLFGMSILGLLMVFANNPKNLVTVLSGNHYLPEEAPTTIDSPYTGPDRMKNLVKAYSGDRLQTPILK